MALDPHLRDPLYKFDTHFPDRLSRLHVSECPSSASRRTKAMRPRAGHRYRTQPVTFDEIKEVDEEPESRTGTDDIEGIKNSLTAFSKSMDGLVSDPRTSRDFGAAGFDDSIAESEAASDQSTNGATPRVPNDQLATDNLPMGLQANRRPRAKKNAKQKVVPD